MTMLAVLNNFKANLLRDDPEKYYSIYPDKRPSTFAPSSPTVALAPVAAATIPAAPTPVQSAGGQIPIQVQVAPYSAQAPAAPAAPAKAKPIDKKYLVIGGVVLALILFALFLRR